MHGRALLPTATELGALGLIGARLAASRSSGLPSALELAPLFGFRQELAPELFCEPRVGVLVVTDSRRPVIWHGADAGGRCRSSSRIVVHVLEPVLGQKLLDQRITREVVFGPHVALSAGSVAAREWRGRCGRFRLSVPGVG